MKTTLATNELSFEILKEMIFTPITSALNIAVMGPPRVGKTTLSQSLIKEAVGLEFTCLYGVTSDFLHVVRDQLRAQGVPPEGKSDKIVFVDMYSWLLGKGQLKGSRLIMHRICRR